MKKVFSHSSLRAGLVAGALSLLAAGACAQQTVDGTADYQYGAPIVCQNVNTQFGDNLNELDVAYAYISGGKLYVTLAGNLVVNNKLNLFIDSVSGGQNRLRGDNLKSASSWYLTRLGDSGAPNGVQFENGFDADYYFGIGNDGSNNLFVDYSDLPTSSGGTGSYLGTSGLAGVLSGGSNPNNIKAALDNSNAAGVSSSTSCAYAVGGTVKTGVELEIPLAAIGNPTGTVRIFAMIGNADNSTVSNQFLPGCGYDTTQTVGNFGEPRGTLAPKINFGANTGSVVGTQYFLAPYAPNGNIIVSRVFSSSPLSSGVGYALSLDEFTAAGSSTGRQVLLPTVASGSNKRFVISGTASSEGQLTRSSDGRYLTIGGYDAPVGQTSVNNTANVARVIARVDSASTVDSSTAITGLTLNKSIRSTSSFDGQKSWFGYETNGAYFTTTGSTAATQVNSTNINGRVTSIFNNQLYISAAASISAVGVGLPESSAAATTVISGLTSVYDFWFADAYNVYLADDSVGLRKFRYNPTTQTWGSVYAVTTSQVRSVVGVWTSPTDVKLFVVLSSGAVSSIPDVVLANATSATLTQLVAPPTNAAYRGVELSQLRVNTAPVASDQAVSTNEDAAKAITLGATDADNDALTYSYTQPAHGTVSGTGPNVTYTPATDFNGSDSFTFKANDGTVDSNVATVSITVNSVNDAPVIVVPGNQVVDELTPVSLSATATDPNDSPANTPFVFDLVSGPAGLTVSSSGAISWTPTEAQGAGDYTVTVRVTDSGAPALSDTKSFSIHVNEVNVAPTADPQALQTPEDTPKNVTLTGSDSDVPTQTLTYVVVGSPAHGSLSGTAPNLLYTPNADYNGSDSFTFKVNDGTVDSSIATISITVTPVNDPPTANPQSDSTNEDTPLNGSVTADDVDGDTLTYSLVGAASHGTAVVNANGTFTYTPAANYHGSDSFTFKANDNVVDSNIATVSITVDSVNDAPAALDVTVETDEDVAISHHAFSASDADNDPLTYEIVDPAGNGTATVNGDGTFTYTPNPNFHGSDSFTYRAKDATDQSNVATVNITVNSVNDAPVAVDGEYSTTQILPVSGQAVATDVDGDTLVYAQGTGPAHGTLTFNTDGSFLFTPSLLYSGDDSFTFTATDGTLTSNTATITIHVGPVNLPPVAVDSSFTTNEDTAYDGAVSGTDPNGNDLTFFVVASPAHGTLTFQPNGLYHYVPFNDYFGPDSFTFKANDGLADSTNTGTVSITVTSVNDAPTAYGQNTNMNEDATLIGQATASDVENDTLQYSIVASPTHGTATMSDSGGFSYHPNSNYNGPDSFTFKVNDGQADSNIATISITVDPVNDPPVAGDDSKTTSEDTTLSASVPTGSDPDGDTLTYQKNADPAHGTLTFASDGTYTYMPEANYFGSDSFTYHANDGSANSNVATISLTVTAVNDVPVASSDLYSTAENTPLHQAAPGVLGNDSDTENDGLSAVLVTSTTHGSLSLNANGSFDYTPNANFAGTDSFTYKANDGQADSNVATVTITVNDVNNIVIEQFASPAPNFFGSSSYDQWEANAMNALANGLSSVGDRSSDPSAYIQLGATANWGEDVATNFSTWIGKLNPPMPFSNEIGNRIHFGVHVFGNGTRFTLAHFYNDMNSSDTANSLDFDGDFMGYPYRPWRIGIDYGPDRTKGTGDDIVYQNGEDENLPVDELIYVGVGNAFDATAESGTNQDKLNAVRCYVGMNAPFVLSNTYQVRDEFNNVLASSTVSVELQADNNVPVAQDQMVGTNQDTPVGIALNATDGDGEALTYSVVAGPSHGMLSGTAPNLIYTPDSGYYGPDSFTFKAADCLSESNVATVSIDVHHVNHAPTASIGTYTTAEDTSVPVVLSASDPDGDSLTYLYGTPAHGTLSGTAPNLTYSPNANYHGPDSFSFHVNDGSVDSNTATVSITVTSVNDAPVAEDDAATTDEDTPLSGNVHATDADTDPLTYSLVSDGQHGHVVVNPGGAYTYTPNANYHGSDSFAFKANDGSADSNIATVAVTVTSVNDAPVANDDSVDIAEDSGFSFNALGNDTDADGDSLHVVSVTQPSHGTASINAAGGIDYTPVANYNGEDSFTYICSDGTVNSSPATIHVTIDPLNDAPVVTVPGLQSTPQGCPVSISGTSVADVDAGSGSMRIVMSAGHGIFSLASTTGVSFITGDGTSDASMEFTGTLANVNAALATLVYKPNTGYSGSDAIAITAHDQGNTGSGGDLSDSESISIQVTPVNAIQFWPSSYTVVDGIYFSGNLASLTASDDNRLRFFDDTESLTGVIDLVGTSSLLCISELTFTAEVSVTRPGFPSLQVRVELFNYETNGFDMVASDDSYSSDHLISATMTSSAMSYVNQSNGEVKARLTWQPYNDEQPEQDGWLLQLDEARWNLSP